MNEIAIRISKCELYKLEAELKIQDEANDILTRQLAEFKAERDQLAKEVASLKSIEMDNMQDLQRYRQALEKMANHQCPAGVGALNYTRIALQALAPAATGQPEKPPLVPLDEWCEKQAKVLRQDIGIHIENAFCGIVPSIDLERLIMLSIRMWTSNRDRMQDLATSAKGQK